MGARYLRKMIDQPLQSSKDINSRLDGVEELVKKIILRDRLSDLLNGVYDIERITGKISYGNVTPKDLVTLKNSLKKLPEIKNELSQVKSQILIQCREDIFDVADVTNMLEKAIDENASALLRDGGFIKEGFNQELDEYRHAKQLAKTWIEKLQEKEIEETGIKNLKISYNKVFGYFIEVNKKDIDKVPLRYQRKQTVANR